MSGVATRVEAERIARAIPCPTCQVEPGVMCIPTWPALNEKVPLGTKETGAVREYSHWRRMQAAVGGDDWWRKVVGAR